MENQPFVEQDLRVTARNHRIAQTICYYTAFVVIGLAAGLLGPTLIALAKQTNSGFSEIGFVFMVHSFGYVVGSTFLGSFYDRIGGHKILALMVVMLSAALFLMPLAPTLPLLLGAAFLLGTAEGTGQVGVNTLLVWLYDQKSTPFLNGAHFCFGIGALTSPILVAQLLSHGQTYADAYRFVAFLILPAILLFLLVPSPEIKKRDAAVQFEPFNYGFVALVALFYFLYLGAEISFGGWISAFATKLNLSDEATAAYLASAFWSALTFGRLIAVTLSVKFSPGTLLVGDLILALVGLAVVGLAGTSFVTTVIGTVIVGLSFASVYPTMFSFAGNRINLTGRVTGFFVMGGSFGAMVFPVLAGYLFERNGALSLILQNLTMICGALAVLLIMLKAFPKKQSENNF